MNEAAGVPAEELVKVDPVLGIKILPHWLAQPYWRPLSSPTCACDSKLSMLNLIDEALTALQSSETAA